MKILIAEDEFVSRRKLEKIITSLGYDLLEAENGYNAWQIWQDERPEIIISDWVMPEMNGLNLCRKVRENEGSQYTYILMVTAKHDTQDLVEAMNAGADDFISKPYIMQELAVRIRAGERIKKFETKDLVIFSLAKLSESRDPETGNHLERIRHYSKELAQALADMRSPSHKINNIFIENIFLTSPLHDIGKVGIPDSILMKPGRLEPDEFEKMKEHCQIGHMTLFEALKKYPRTDYLQMGAEIALCHHEKFNGTGYPKGLSARQIPLAARIVSLADVYDALVSKRVYKDAFSHNKAKEIIIEERGKHFDPQVVDAFLACEDKFLQIRQKFS
ncbi:MAG: response regulator [Desulfobulbaceae bacterium]|nr:response regulator [Desulfobulbaceae bacterium]